MKTSNPYLLAEIDTLEEITRKDSSELEVVKRIEKLEAALHRAEIEMYQNQLNTDFINHVL